MKFIVMAAARKKKTAKKKDRKAAKKAARRGRPPGRPTARAGARAASAKGRRPKRAAKAKVASAKRSTRRAGAAKPAKKARAAAGATAKARVGKKATSRVKPRISKPKTVKATGRKAATKQKVSQKQREREKLQKQREREKLQKQREREKLQKQREREKLQKQREQAKARREQERQLERERKAKEAERQRLQKEREAQREAAQKAREQARAQKQAEREAERLRKQQEREQLREEARRKKEEERLRKEAEREAYRKAKEAEQEKLRAEREAAKRALEGKIARQTKRAQRAGLGRGSTTRVYRPDAIPNQSGTTRRTVELSGADMRFANLRPPAVPPAVSAGPAAAVGEAPAPIIEEPTPPPPTPVPPPERIEDRYQLILSRLSKTSEQFQREYQESFDMSWIYHDSALEGVVYSFQELKTAVDPNITVVPDSSLQPVCEEIRRHKAAIDLVRELAERRRVPITVDTVKKLYLTLHPEEGDIKSVKYRKDIPQHRLYFHEYAPPDKIVHRVRQIMDWLSGPEPKKLKSPVRIAARVHYDLLRVFPFPTDSGKVARLLMNILLMRADHPPAIIHSTERQRYYEALRGALPTIVSMVDEAIENGLVSIEKLLDEEEKRQAS